MEKITEKLVSFRRIILEVTAIVVVYLVGGLLSPEHNLIGFLWMLAGCIGLFLYYAISNRNLLDFRGVLIASITGGVACCQLRLSEIQTVWEVETWICHALALCCFCIGHEVVKHHSGKRVALRTKNLWDKYGAKKFHFAFQPKRAFYATIFLAVMPIVLFCIQVKIKGFIPLFVQRYDAYMLFYTRLSIFINLVILAAPMAFWCLKNLKLNLWQRIAMYAIIPLPTIIFQLMVQRGLFIWSICILLVMVYFESKRKFLGVTMTVCLMIAGVLFSSAMRGIPADAMQTIWKMDGQITISTNKPTDPTETTDEDSSEDTSPEHKPSTGQTITIQIPEFVYAPYYYVINGIENFDYMVKDLDEHSWGLMQVSPFTVILRFPALKDKIAALPRFTLLPNSTSILYNDFYYDFGLIGVAIEMLLLGMLCAVVQNATLRKRDFFAYLEHGVLLAVIVTAFFAAWISTFGTWLFAGTAFLIFLYCYFSKNNMREAEAQNG